MRPLKVNKMRDYGKLCATSLVNDDRTADMALLALTAKTLNPKKNTHLKVCGP